MEHGLIGVMLSSMRFFPLKGRAIRKADNFQFIKKRCAIHVYTKGNAHVYMKGNARHHSKTSTKPFHPLKAKPLHRNFYNRDQKVEIEHSFIWRSHGHCMRITKNGEQLLPLVILMMLRRYLALFKQRLFLNMGQRQVCSFQTLSIISLLHLKIRWTMKTSKVSYLRICKSFSIQMLQKKVKMIIGQA